MLSHGHEQCHHDTFVTPSNGRFVTPSNSRFVTPSHVHMSWLHGQQGEEHNQMKPFRDVFGQV